MRIGVVFPQTEIGQDPEVIRDYAQAVESMGYTHILAFDSVIGPNPDRPGGWDSQYDYRHAFHEPFVLFGFCAGVTRHIELVTGVLILPQRQTTLVAKQAAAVDVLSAGRLRLGIGVGWNPVEFEALGENMRNRGRRVEEQLELMRLLWTRALVTYAGQWHRVPNAGINPLPIQRPIPVWMGGEQEAVLRRAARLADGWITLQSFRPGPPAQQTVDRLFDFVRDAGRDARHQPSLRQHHGARSLATRRAREDARAIQEGLPRVKSISRNLGGWSTVPCSATRRRHHMTQSDVSAHEPVSAGSRSPLLELATRDLREPSPTLATRGHWPSWLHAQVPEGLAFCLSCWRVITPWQLGVEVCIGALETTARLAAAKASLPRPEP